jgi:hypothetical protein
VSDETSAIPVTDIDQPFPTLTSEGIRRPAPAASGGDSATPTVEAALRDVLGWRPRAQDTSAFTAALTATFQLSEVEGHVVATYSPRGFAMQADLGAVSGGQASLYSRALSARTQMLTLLDGLTPLRPDADIENCEAFRKLVRGALTGMITEFGTPGGPRVAVVDAFLRQLFGSLLWQNASVTADTVGGQLGQLRVQFGLEDVFVNNVDQESVRTAYWTLVDLALDINRAWRVLRSQFTGTGRDGFLGTQLVLVNQLLSAVAEQVDDLEAALDSVFVSAADRQTIRLPNANNLTLDGLLSWVRMFVTEEGPRIARDSGRDGIATSFTPTIINITSNVTLLMSAIGRPGIVLTATERKALGIAASTVVQYSVITLDPPGDIPPGMQASRIQVAVAGLHSLLNRISQIAMYISRSPVVVPLDAIVVNSQNGSDTLLALRGINIEQSFVPVFQHPEVKVAGSQRLDVLVPRENQTSYDGDTVTAVFDQAALHKWLHKYDGISRSTALEAVLLDNNDSGLAFAASALPVRLLDGVTGDVVDTSSS